MPDQHSGSLPTPELLRERYHYDPQTGILTYRVMAGNRRPGDIVGSIVRVSRWKKYLLTRCSYLPCYVHRIIWTMQTGRWPPADVDHIDNNGLNNQWDNLREASRSQNMHNAAWENRPNLATGSRGVSQSGKSRWSARIRISGKTVPLGTFDSIEEAARAYALAKEKLIGSLPR